MNKLFTLLLFIPLTTFSQAFLTNPMEGIEGKDYTIVNYVDWSFDSIHDHNCGSKTYDGHQGTDFVLRSFRQMDSGVYILAAANGRVTYAMDSLFDREKESVLSKEFGNYLCLKHPNKYYSYYAHIKKNSLLVNVGDSVVAGQRIAQVASSGNSTDPHLHFELWYDSSFVVDPFTGPCGNPSSLWLNTPTYDSSFTVWQHGLHNDTVNLDILRERAVNFPEENRLFFPYDKETVSLWSHIRGLRKGDSLTVKWFDDTNEFFSTFTYTIDMDYWYYYYWTTVQLPHAVSAAYKVIIERNGVKIIEDSFNTYKIGIKTITSQKKCDGELIQSILKDEIPLSYSVKLYNLNGADISHWLKPNTDLKLLPKGIYFIEIRDAKNGVCYEKFAN